ncbi:MAG TPA: Holliday junction resolvase [Candidatus Thermoplasmatota archaeon]|nr:Holliday junction resolvase [Candidatus Thermoplasmatota archaeon]
MAIAYERELKGILSAEPPVLSEIARVLPAEAAKNYEKVAARPFLVVRAAGSLGCDLVALRDDVAFPIEVKSGKEEAIHLSNTAQMKLQAQAMSRECARAGVIALYAFRRKNQRGQDAWRVYAIPAAGFQGRAKILYEHLPKLAVTERGNYVMRWREGMPLNLFLAYLC